jgi:crotonobetaine/carnitine-CoA ligase
MDLVGNRNVRKMFEHTVREHPNNVFVCFGDQELTYAQADAAVTRAANAFLRVGIRKGDQVAVHLPNCPEWIYAVLGLHKIGAVAVTSNTQYKGATC